MCSVHGDDDLADLMLPAKTSTPEGAVCRKCKKRPAQVVIRINDPFCKECFQEYCTHKFRACLGKAKVVRDGERVLLAYSGGAASAALVHLVQMGISSQAVKKLRFIPGIAYVDEGAALGLTSGDRLRMCEKVSQEMSKTGWASHIGTLEEVIHLDKATQETMPPEDLSGHPQLRHFSRHVEGASGVSLRSVVETSAKERRLKEMLDSVSDTTSKEEIIKTLRMEVLTHLARRNGYSKVMVADSASRLSVKLLSSIALGRGSSAPLEVGFADTRDDVMIVRPLREFTAKEVAMYNAFNSISSLAPRSLTTAGPAGASVERLTQDFVYGLQADYPSTVSTVFRTGDKLKTREFNRSEACVLCGGPMDTASSALEALQFSSSLASKLADAKVKAQAFQKPDKATGGARDCCGAEEGCCLHDSPRHRTDVSASLEEVVKECCFGCRRIAVDVGESALLPEYVLRETAWRARRKKMLEAVKDTLYLGDSD